MGSWAIPLELLRVKCLTLGHHCGRGESIFHSISPPKTSPLRSLRLWFRNLYAASVLDVKLISQQLWIKRQSSIINAASKIVSNGSNGEFQNPFSNVMLVKGFERLNYEPQVNSTVTNNGVWDCCLCWSNINSFNYVIIQQIYLTSTLIVPVLVSAWCMSVSCHKGVAVSPHPSTHEGCGLWFMCLIMKVNHKYNKKHYRWTLFLLSVGISVRNHRITEPSASAALGDTAELQFSAAKALMSNEVWNCDETKPSLVNLLVKNLNVFILLAVF